MASSASCAASGASSHPATPVRSPRTRSRRLTWRRSYALDPADDLVREIRRHLVHPVRLARVDDHLPEDPLLVGSLERRIASRHDLGAAQPLHVIRTTRPRHLVLVPPNPLAHRVVTHAVAPPHGTPAHRGDLPLQPRVWRPIHLARLGPGNAAIRTGATTL